MRALLAMMGTVGCAQDPTTGGDTDTDDSPTTSGSANTASTAETSETGTPETDCSDGLYDGPPFVATVNVTCSDETADIAASLVGLSAVGTPVIFMQETGAPPAFGQWSEEHGLVTDSFDPCGYWEELTQTIEELSVGLGEWSPGAASAFTCDDHLSKADVMTMAVYVEDLDSPDTDCLAFGHDAVGLILGEYDDDRVGVEPSFDLSSCTAGI